MYVNPFMVVSNSKYTKHFYIEGQRIVSKLGEMGVEQELLKPKSHAGDSTKNPVQWDTKKDLTKDIIIANLEALGLNGAVFTAGKSGKMPYGQIKKYFRGNDVVINPGTPTSTTTQKTEDMQFYYNPDHLGSSNYITDASGEVYQHQEYFPFGETFVEERNDAEYTTYLFNGKELDEETGLYYYGARYYDPRASIFYGIDRLAEKYYFSSPYAYCLNSPIILLDPNGEGPWTRIIGGLQMVGGAVEAVVGGVGGVVTAETGVGAVVGYAYYDPRISLWQSVDFMTEKFPGSSSYAYCKNNPVFFVDSEGHEPITAIIDAITAFAVEAGMSYVENIVLNDMDASTAFDNIRWGDAGIEAAKSYGLSLFITGVGSTKALAKAANSKIGKVTLEFTANMVGEIMKSYNKGEFNDENGDFDLDRFLNTDFQGLMQGALIEALVVQGFSKKADELRVKLEKAQTNLAKQESKLNKSLNKGASEKTIANRTIKVDKAQKKVVKTMAETGAVSTSKEIVGKGLNKANEQRRNE